MLANKNILLISPEPWSHIFVSKHHYAIHLGKRGNKVFFVNPPCSNNEVVNTEYKNVWQVNYKGFPRGLRFFPSFLQKYYIKKIFQRLQRLCKVDFEIIWSFDNSVFFDFSALPKHIFSISHIVDLNQNFQTAKAAKTADFCFGVSTPILNRLKTYNDNAFFINHGCYKYSGEGKIVLPGNNKIKAFYAGNLDSTYIDWNLFKQTIANQREVDFILAGPWLEDKIKREVQLLSNAYYVGQLKADVLINYNYTVDILLLIYKADEFREQLSNPHKMMEYLESGRMIVATYTGEYVELTKRGLLLMAQENKEFPQLFKSASQDLKYWNSKEKQNLRQAYAEENTYDKQIDRIEKLFAENIVL